MEKWFENKRNKYRYRKENKNDKYNDPYKDKVESDYEYGNFVHKNTKRRKGLIWGFIWLFIQTLLIYIFIKTRIFVTLIPIPLIFAIKSFSVYFKNKR